MTRAEPKAAATTIATSNKAMSQSSVVTKTVKANSTLPIPGAGKFFIVIAIVPAQTIQNKLAQFALVSTRSGSLVPYKPGQGLAEAFDELQVKNTTAVDFTITLLIGTSPLINSVMQSEDAPTYLTSDELTLDNTTGGVSLTLPGIVMLDNGFIYRRKEMSIQVVAGDNPIAVSAVGSILPPGVNQGAGIAALGKYGYVGLGAIVGISFQYGRGQLVPVDATGKTPPRVIQTDAPILLETQGAFVANIPTILLLQTWYLVQQQQ